jgi:hypothetical protein
MPNIYIYIYTYKVKGSGCIPIIYELYHNAEVYLDRKYERAMKILKDAGVY